MMANVEARGTRGRPPAASRTLLQEAALELFLESGYAGTTIEQITQRAGVSRNTFFNYFEAKGDVFWVELDAAMAELTRRLLSAQERGVGEDADGPFETIMSQVLAVGAQFGPERVPFVLTQYALIGSANELQASALHRLSAQATVIARFLSAAGVDSITARSAAYGVLGGVVAAAQEWAAAGRSRHSLESYLRRAVGPVVAGFTASSPS